MRGMIGTIYVKNSWTRRAVCERQYASMEQPGEKGNARKEGLRNGVASQVNGKRPVMTNSEPMLNSCSSKILYTDAQTVSSKPVESSNRDIPNSISVLHRISYNRLSALFVKVMESKEKRPEMPTRVIRLPGDTDQLPLCPGGVYGTRNVV